MKTLKEQIQKTLKLDEWNNVVYKIDVLEGRDHGFQLMLWGNINLKTCRVSGMFNGKRYFKSELIELGGLTKPKKKKIKKRKVKENVDDF